MARANGNSIVVGEHTLPLQALPARYMDWIDSGRRKMYGQLCGKSDAVRFFPQHLPVLVTRSAKEPFPFNCCNKGVGFIPKDEHLSECIELFQATLRDTRDKPWRESLRARLETASRFYFDRERIDPRAISTLEIFERTTFRNLSRRPLASLLFTGELPDYTSFQLNCAVEVVGEDDPRHTFILLARNLFEYDSFHIAQPQFRYAYIFWITEVLDKTPVRVGKRPRLVAGEGDLPWQPDALQAISRAPAMIQQHIRNQVERYARSRGAAEVTVALVEGARSVHMAAGQAGEETVSDYRRIYVALDGSDLSNAAMEMAVSIGKRHGAELVGSHVYAARLHDRRFRSMESGLPEEFRKEQELERQRKIHDSLITKGLELISDSYLVGMAEACRARELPFSGVSLEGRNWQQLARDIAANDYDLVALGGHGVGRVAGALLGTVTERLLRRVRRDMLICKVDPARSASDRVVVCLDGSERSWGALERGIQLAQAFDKKLVAISAFDPYFHYTMFATLSKALTTRARQVFRFEEQEKLHEDIIDTGLARIYQSHLDIGRRIAEEKGVELETHLLDGKAYEKILDFVRADPPWLLVLGRTGIHSDEEMDIGGQTENVCRRAECNVLVVETKARPPDAYQAEETVTWTKEAQALMERVPAMARGMAMKAVQNHCLAEGHTVVTRTVLVGAIRRLLPPDAIERMGIELDGQDETAEGLDRIDLTFRCSSCGQVHRGLRPEKCPVCGAAGSTFRLEESRTSKDAVASTSMDGRELQWEREVLDRLEKTEPVLRRQLEAKLEKQALTRRVSLVTPEMLEAVLPSTDGPAFTEDAILRLERVPAGFMRTAARDTVEEYARRHGLSEVDLAVVEGGLAEARRKMESVLSGQVVESGPGSSFQCLMCGYVADRSRPDCCPACESAQFRGLTQKEREAMPAAACEILSWDEDALAHLERVPAGFMRAMTSCRIEGWARKAGSPRVTMEVVRAKYQSWEEGSRGYESRLEWSAGALARIERVPEFIRPMVMAEIERSTEDAGGARVDEEALDGILSRWGALGRFHGR